MERDFHGVRNDYHSPAQTRTQRFFRFCRKPCEKPRLARRAIMTATLISWHPSMNSFHRKQRRIEPAMPMDDHFIAA